jgi:hypothetical protein
MLRVYRTPALLLEGLDGGNVYQLKDVLRYQDRVKSVWSVATQLDNI